MQLIIFHKALREWRAGSGKTGQRDADGGRDPVVIMFGCRPREFSFLSLQGSDKAMYQLNLRRQLIVCTRGLLSGKVRESGFAPGGGPGCARALSAAVVPLLNSLCARHWGEPFTVWSSQQPSERSYLPHLADEEMGMR